ncbi:MAG: hypothetical protein AAGC77_07075 [Pseudomonadota bacterium]
MIGSRCVVGFVRAAAISIAPFFIVFSAGLDANGSDSSPIAVHAEGIEEAERLGNLVYRKDQAAWAATDYFLDNENISSDPDVAGWVSEIIDGKTVRVSFLAIESNRLVVRYAVDVEKGNVRTKTAKVLKPGAQLTNRQRLMSNARAFASNTDFMRCSPRYNTVVIPHEGTTFYVYLLAAMQKSNEIVIGGHHRFLIDAEIISKVGDVVDHIVEQRAFTTRCLTLRPPPNISASALTGAVVSHVTAPYPEEPHILASLIHNMEISVVAGGALWMVKDGEIELSEMIE